MMIYGGTSSSHSNTDVQQIITGVSTQHRVRPRIDVSTQPDRETPQSEQTDVSTQRRRRVRQRIYVPTQPDHETPQSEVPKLLEILLLRNYGDYRSKEARNTVMAGGTRLGLVARTAGDDIVPLVMPFIEENISKSSWWEREAAIRAFGSILEGPSPDKLVPLVKKYLWSMLVSLRTTGGSNFVRETSAWTLGRMFKFLHGSASDPPIITQANIKQIIIALVQSMRDVSNVAEKACGALYLLAQGYEDAGSTFPPLTPFFREIVRALLTVTHREDAGESRLRTAAYEALNEVVRCSNDETTPLMVMKLVPVIMTELHKTLVVNQVSSDEKQNELQGLLCGCLQVIIQKLGSSKPTPYHFIQFADQMMSLFLRMLELQNFEDYQVRAITVGVVGDVCRALEDKILPYCDGIMTQLLKDLSSNQLPYCDSIMTQHRSVKPPIFSCFGDIALAIGENFEKYLLAVGENFEKYLYYAMPMLQIAADDDMTEYINSLRNGILEAYSGIFQGFKGSPKTELLMPYAPHVLQFLDSLYMEKDMDDVVMKTAIGVLGDLADTLGSNAGPLIQQSVSSKDFLKECLSSDDHLIKESAERAKLAVSRAISF